MVFPRSDRQYALITDAATGTAETARGLGALITQKDEINNFFVISYASRQLKDHKNTIRHFCLNQLLQILFNEYIKGKKVHSLHRP
jgi:hypothetical protein